MIVDHSVRVRNAVAAQYIAYTESSFTASRIDVDDDHDFYLLIRVLEGEGAFVAALPSGRGVPVVRELMTDRNVVEHVRMTASQRLDAGAGPFGPTPIALAVVRLVAVAPGNLSVIDERARAGAQEVEVGATPASWGEACRVVD